MKNILFELSVNNNVTIIPEIAVFVSKSANKLGLSDKKSHLLCFAIESILELRAKEISSKNPIIKIIVEDTGVYFKFSVIDLGKPYVLTKNQQSILKKKLVDKYSFSQSGRKGQCLSFLFKYDKKNSEHIKVVEEKLLDDECHFRIIKNDDDDILKAITCLYETYGYEYYHQNLYSVKSFKKYMLSGRYIPVIGENKNKQAICYCALDENSWFLGVPELSNLATRPFAQGKGYATSIFFEIENVARKMNYEGVHVSAVAYHPYTQKMCNKFDYVPSAIEYSINPIGTGGDTSGRRLDCVIGVKLFNKDKMHHLFIDKECNKLITKVFNDLKTKFVIENRQSFAHKNEIEYCLDVDTNNAFFKIDACSKTIKEEILDIINREEIKDIDTITVNLNISKRSSIFGYRVLKELGFIVTGCIPGCKNGSFMLLQKFKTKSDYDKIVLLDNYKELEKIIFELNELVA